MIDYINILQQNPAGVMATQSDNGINTRMFQFLFADKNLNKVYFCTNTEKKVYSQINKYPQVSFCTRTQDFSQVLSISGKASFINDIELKQKVLDENPKIQTMYKTADNPIFTMFYVDVAEVQTFSFTEGPKQYNI